MLLVNIPLIESSRIHCLPKNWTKRLKDRLRVYVCDMCMLIESLKQMCLRLVCKRRPASPSFRLMLLHSQWTGAAAQFGRYNILLRRRYPACGGGGVLLFLFDAFHSSSLSFIFLEFFFSSVLHRGHFL